MKRCALLLLALLPLCAAVGDFESPVPLAVGASTGWLSLINGNQELSNPAANLCG